MRTRKSGYFEDADLPPQNWEWPKGTWFQGRLNYIRQQQPSRIQKTHLKTSFLPHTDNVSCDQAKERKVAAFQIHGGYDPAKLFIASGLDNNLSDLERKLCNLLKEMMINGPATYDDINQLRSFSNFSNTEKAMLRQLFILGVKSAEKESQEDRVWAYQRLLRVLFLNQSLDQSIPKSIGGVLSMNQRRAPKPEQLKITSPRMLVQLYKEQYLILLNRYRYLFGKTAVIALGFLIISSMPYLLFVHYQKPNDIAVSKEAVPRPVLDSIPRFDTPTFSQPAEVVTAGLQAKSIPSLNVDSSTHVS